MPKTKEKVAEKSAPQSRAIANEPEKRSGRSLEPPEKPVSAGESLPALQSLVDKQLHMNPEQWRKFKAEKLTGMEGSTRAQWISLFQQAELAYQRHLKYLSRELPASEDESIDDIRKQAKLEDGLEQMRSRMGSATGLARMEPKNRIFEGRLILIEDLKQRVRLAGERMAYASGNETEQLDQEISQSMALLKQTVQEALGFASESGSKEGAINQVVVHDQVKYRMIKALSPENLMYIFNENMAYAFNALHRNRQEQLAQAAMQAAPFLKRSTLEVRRIRQKLEAEDLLSENFKKLERDRKALDKLGKKLTGVKTEKPIGKGMDSKGSLSDATKILEKAGISSHEDLMELLRTFLLKVARAFDESRFEGMRNRE